MNVQNAVKIHSLEYFLKISSSKQLCKLASEAEKSEGNHVLPNIQFYECKTIVLVRQFDLRLSHKLALETSLHKG